MGRGTDHAGNNGETHFMAHAVAADLDSYLTWARHAMFSEIVSESRVELQLQYDRIQSRLNDPRLYVGFFGEFSSGKSTLLNALLGARVLPTSALVTTSIATNIYPAESDHISVVLRGSGTTLRYGTYDFNAWYLGTTGQSGLADVRTVLDTLIRNKKISKYLESLDLGIRGTLIGPDVVIIDTPGFNSDESLHSEIAELVAERVDLAVVLIPANSPGSITLANFITNVLATLHDRCVFLLTKCRLIDIDEREDLESYVRWWLSTLGFESPLLLRADASDVAVAELDPSIPSMPDVGITPADAVDETAQIAETLEVLATDHRAQLIRTSVAALLDDLLSAISEASALRSRTLETTEKELAAITITDLEGFLADWRRQMDGKMHTLTKRLLQQQASSSLPTAELAKLLDNAITAIDTSDEITAITAELMTRTTKALKQWIGTCINNVVRADQVELIKHSRRLAESFQEEYGELARLAGQGREPPNIDQAPPAVSIQSLDLDVVFLPLRQKARELQAVAKMKSYGGAAAGAAVGTAIAPGVGTVIGGFLGLVFGSGRDKQKAEFRVQVERIHTDSERMAQDLLRNSASIIDGAVNVSIDALCDRYRKIMGPAVAALKANERQRRNRIRQELGEALTMRHEAEKQRATLRQQLLGRGTG